MASAGRTIVIGVDGVAFELMDHYVRAGELPCLASLARRGAFVRLRSVRPPKSPPAWTTITTGLNPGKHGILDFLQHNPTDLSRRLISSRDCRVRRFYHYAGDHGRRCCVANIPITYPPEPVPGVLVTGMLTPEGAEEFTHPASLSAELLDLFPRLSFGARLAFSVDRKHEYLDHLLRTTEQHGRLALHLFRNVESDLFFFVFMQSDHASHKLWGPFDADARSHGTADGPFYEGVPRVLKNIDEQMEALLAETDEQDTVLVLSDHGGGPLKGLVNVNRWLVREGFLAPRGGLRSSLKRTMARLDVVARAYRLVARMGLGKLAGAFSSRFRLAALNSFQSLEGGIDWERTRAYVATSFPGIFINREGREPCGTVAPGAEYDAVCRDLTERLHRLKDEQGRPVVDEVCMARDLFEGPCTEEFPDIIFSMAGYSLDVSKKIGLDPGDLFEDEPKGITGTHTLDGFLAAAGPGVRVGADAEGANVGDIAPTVLYAMGCPIPTYMDGRPLLDLFDEEYVRRNPVQRDADAHPGGEQGERRTQDGSGEVIDRLRDLGYV